MKETKPKRPKNPFTDEGTYVSICNAHCNGLEDCDCRTCAWERALKANLEKDNNEDKDA